MVRHVALALLVAAPILAQQQTPATPAARILAAWLEAFNSGDIEKIRAFDRDFRPATGPRPPAEVTAAMREQTGGFTLIRIEKDEPTTLVALVQERDSDTIGRIELVLTTDDPPKVSKMAARVVPRPPDLALPRLTEAQALAALDAKIDELAAADRFSGVVLVARGGKILLEKMAGHANREAKTPITPETRFRIGSMNKMFTSIATLQQVEAGTLALTDPIGKHLTDYPNKNLAEKVTIGHLLTHTGGTGDIFGPEFAKNRLTLREHADYLKLYGARDPVHPPGAEMRYSNYGYVLLGAVLERVTGMPYYDVVRKNIFERAGMTGTDSRPESESITHRSAGYMRRDGVWVVNTDTLPWRGTAAGGGYSTARDLLRFAQALESGTLISKPLLFEATSEKQQSYGYGFTIRRDGDLRWYGHGGGAPGMNGELAIFPTLGYVIVGLSNMDPPAATRVVQFFLLRMPTGRSAS